ncbi:MAG: Ni/Fe-hydrogenase cytochrome b subunit [Myxococcales bacterium]|nr:MAG: Ni/Fe-hydrogenase cytochrome b subunit [Myxococcales bacterium]
MTAQHAAKPLQTTYFTPGAIALAGLAILGASVAVWRFVVGLQDSTNLTDANPWGIWIAVDVATGVALAAGGFTTAALAHIFHRERYGALVRPAILTALLGYTFVVIGLMADLGRPYNIWKPLIYPQGNSVLFEVAICVMTYLTVLYLEFVPVVAERFESGPPFSGRAASIASLIRPLLKPAAAFAKVALPVLLILGVVLSFMHQSSLGTLMVIAPTKMNPLWYSPYLPAMFLLSAIMVGFPMVIVEGSWATWAFRREPETPLLADLARFTPILLTVYLAVKLIDLASRGVLLHVVSGAPATIWWWAEVGLGVVLPLLLLISAKIRRSRKGLFVAALLVVLGVALNRINVFLVAYNPPFVESRYVPAWSEIVVTLGLIAGLVLAYRWAVITFPVLAGPHAGESHR